ncbi:MAG: hypothetical protein ACYS9X_24435 [Planctomycetota bacterium]|jgi:hypothetical protein
MPPSDDPEPPGARFPFAAAALCAACVAMATWLWIRHSYAWDVTPGELLADGGGWPRRLQYDVASCYVRLRGVPSRGPWLDHGSGVVFVSFHDGPEREWPFVSVVFRDVGSVPAPGTLENAFGRLVSRNWFYPVPQTSDAGNLLVVDATRGRLTGESVAGLVVGAMGAFVFWLHLRRWLRVRQAEG